MYRNIIWDVDGTLFDTYPSFTRAFGSTLREHGVEADPAWIASLAKVSAGHCIETLASKYKLPAEAIQEGFLRHYEMIDYVLQPPFSGAKDVCEHVRSGGGANVIVTHRRTGGTIGLLQAHGMRELFQGWITGDDGLPKKPDPAAFTEAITRFTLDPAETMAIGDRDIDTRAAQAAGLFACQFGDGGQSNPELKAGTFAEVLAFLRKQKGGRTQKAARGR